MAKAYQATIVSEKVYGTELYSVHFYSYGSEDGEYEEGHIHGMVSEQEAQQMKVFWETGGHKIAMMFMAATYGPDYTDEEWVAMEIEMERNDE